MPQMPQALTLSPVIRNYGINLGAPYRVSTSLHQNQAYGEQIKLAGPAQYQEPVLCACVCVCGEGGAGGGGRGLSCCKYYLRGMHGSSSLCLSDRYTLVIHQLIMIIIDKDNDYY